MDLTEIDDFGTLLCADTPMLDVRAPVEFSQGAFPHSINAPLLNDEQRHLVGGCYKNEGHDAAVRLGEKLVSGDVKEACLRRWTDFLRQHPDGVLYCFRGGMRSQISQQWIYQQTGIMVPRVKGGYKALRSFLIERTESLALQLNPVILAGRTGSGKTLLLKKLDNAIDLEGLANHRGSSFGRQLDPQPTQIDFENRLAIELLKFARCGLTDIVLEDESPNIGSVHIPHALYQRMEEAPGVVLEASEQQRVEITLKEYIIDMLERYVDAEGDAMRGFSALSEYLHSSLLRVKRRLGGKTYTEILGLMNQALKEQAVSGHAESHRTWLRLMLIQYYDPMYDYQHKKRGRMIEYSGEFTAILSCLRDRR